MLQLVTTLEICSRCLNHEINSWINEKWNEINEDVRVKINEELKTIKLVQGKCIVCNNSLVSQGTAENILSVLEENNISEKIREEFKKLFCGLLF